MDGHRTAQLWLQYMDMVDILRRFVRAERTGNWHLHLRTLREMLPFLTAAGHNLYTKSIYIYLLQMQDLPFSHPEVFESFSNGHHVVRRSERYWADVTRPCYRASSDEEREDHRRADKGSGHWRVSAHRVAVVNASLC